MNKQCVVVLMAVSALISPQAWAAREEHTFEVSLTVPNRSFYILPSESNWIHRPLRLEWDYPKGNLKGVSKNFDVRHDTSAIEARLESAPYLSNGRPVDDILLLVKFNGVQLSHDPRPQQVLSPAEAAVGKRVLLQIDPIVPAGGYRQGDYSGNVLLLFSARAPGE